MPADGGPLPGPPPVRWGVIGATARIAQLAVLPALAASPKCDLLAVASEGDPDGSWNNFGARRHHRSYAALLADADIEAVYIPLPNSLHAEWTIKSAEAGKHVLCEKPLATSAIEADAMANACDTAGVLLMEAYMTPFHPRSAVLNDWLRTGRLGQLRFAHTTFTGVLRDPNNHRWHPQFGGGALLDVGIYCLAPLLLAADRLPIDLRGSAALTESGVDASFSGWLDFGDGFSAAFECSFETPERQQIEVVGTQAVLRIERVFTPGVDDTRIEVLHRTGKRESIECGGGDPYRGMLDHFSTVLRGGAALRRGPVESIELLGVLDRLRMTAQSR